MKRSLTKQHQTLTRNVLFNKHSKLVRQQSMLEQRIAKATEAGNDMKLSYLLDKRNACLERRIAILKQYKNMK